MQPLQKVLQPSHCPAADYLDHAGIAERDGRGAQPHRDDDDHRHDINQQWPIGLCIGAQDDVVQVPHESCGEHHHRVHKNKKHHPLYFLVSPKTRSWAYYNGSPIVDAGHTLGHNAYGFAYALEDPVGNRRLRGDMVETPGGFAFSIAYKIGGVYIDRRTAQTYEGMGLLPKGTCKRAKYTVGWIDFSDL